MADLTFTLLQAVSGVPANSFVIDADSDVAIKIGNFIGESVQSLDDEKVTEALLKLLEAARLAQVDYNAALGANPATGTQISSFGSPSWSNPVDRDDGSTTATKTIQMTAVTSVPKTDYEATMV